MEKRYQVFISSTFADLEEVRREIIQSILELNCFPAGMEMFPATNKSQFEHIKKVIDMSDYYILIIAGRYGSVNDDGISYTEMEYDYAKSKGIPILVFERDNIDSLPVNKTDNDPVKREKLEAFKNKAKANRLVRLWLEETKLPGEVFKSLSKLFKEEPRVGWVRADSVENINENYKNISYENDVSDYDFEHLKYELNKVNKYTYISCNNYFVGRIEPLNILKELAVKYDTDVFNNEQFKDLVNYSHKENIKWGLVNYKDDYVIEKYVYNFKRILLKLDIIEQVESNYIISKRGHKFVDDLILKGEW